MYKFIFVDDEKAIADGFRELINWEEIGFECMGSFYSGAEAISFLETNRVDMVVTDISMPDMNGIELSKHIFENWPSVMTVFLSAYNEIDYAKEGMRYNVRFYLNKPLTIKQLKAEFADIREYLDEEKLKNNFAETSVYKGYFNGLAGKSVSSDMYDFEDCGFFLFELNICGEPVSEKLLRALYSIFSLTYKKVKFCILGNVGDMYEVLIFSREEIAENWSEKFADGVKDCLDVDIEIKNIRRFDNIGMLEEYYKTENVTVSESTFKAENAVVTNAVIFIENNLSEPLSLEMVAKECFVSTSWLSRLFKWHMGENISAYILQKRIDMAKDLLIKTDMPAHDIAEKVGMRNLPYFYSIFKKDTGMTPKEFRVKKRR